MYEPASNSQLKPFAMLTPTKHLRSNCDSQFDPRRLRRLTGCSGCRKTPLRFVMARTVQ
ncbi:MAG: hypothetical protein ACI8Z1_002221 [Candidatus Azotimanducaceae bacterium]|jgi:hypothetical protein